MKTLIQWTHTHALKAIGFAVLLTMIATYASFRDDQFWPCVTAFGIVLCLFVFVYLWTSRTLALILVATLALPIAGEAQQEESPPPPTAENGVGCAIVVIIVGGVIVYGLNKFCQKVFSPPPTNANPTTIVAGYAGGGAAASHNYSSCGSCFTPAYVKALASGAAPTTFEVIGYITEDELQQPVAIIESAGLAPVQTNTVTWADYVTAVQSHGITVTEHGQGEKYYAVDGVPCTAEECPISFNDRVINVSNGSAMSRVTVERSEDLQNWTTVLETYVSAGYRFKFVDTSIVSQAFYRITR